MKLLLDTSVLIDHLRGDARATTALAAAIERGDELWGVTLVRTEILAGMRPEERSATYALLGILQWQEVTVDLADRAGEIARTWLPSHPGVDTVDYVIAAAAEQLGATLWTRNVKHFPMIPELSPPYG